MSLRTNTLGSSRASPFRRPESPSSMQRPTTPTYQSTRPATPSRLQNSSIMNKDGSWSPSTANLRSVASRDPPMSPTRNSNPVSTTPGSPSTVRNAAYTGNAVNQNSPRSPSTFTSSPAAAPRAAAVAAKQPAYPTESLSKLPASQVRELREAFSLLDRDGDGMVERGDVVETLTQLGLDASSAAVAEYFPYGSSSVPMSTFLTGISMSLAKMESANELLAALAAFDDDDSGQIDVLELKEALTGMLASPQERVLSSTEVDAVLADYSGKRAFSKYASQSSHGRGEVFRYREWVADLGPVAAGNQTQRAHAS